MITARAKKAQTSVTTYVLFSGQSGDITPPANPGLISGSPTSVHS